MRSSLLSGNRQPTLRVRDAAAADLEGLLALARLAGDGLTNLPADRNLLAKRIAESARPDGGEAGGCALLVLEADGAVAGAAAVWPRIGARRPFYSFRRTGAADDEARLTLTTEFTGSAEVGGLIVAPGLRGGVAGRLIARARYMLIALRRSGFPDQVVADLRGWQDARGRSPVWSAIGARRFGSDFREADRRSLSDLDFIGPQAPRRPIPIRRLPAAARAAIGRPHDDGRGALRLLLEEGFSTTDCVDVFDGGPTLAAPVDTLRLVRERRASRLIGPATSETDAPLALVAQLSGAQLRAVAAPVCAEADGARLPAWAIAALEAKPGDEIHHAPL